MTGYRFPGSRIPQRNLISASPVTQVSSQEIAFQAASKVEDMLNRLPQVYAAQTSTLANGSAGTATVDLRGLGSERTLVLINGRRLPSGSPVGGGRGADLNQIPSALIDRVEELTGGSSAAYGSDAIAGVVNFITKRDFEGFALDYQYSFYQSKNNASVLDLSRARGFDNTGVPASVYGNPGLDSPANQYNFLQGGNPLLEPEKSDTVSFGAVLSPTFVEGLIVSIDYFNIEVEDAIDTVPQRFTLDNCLETVEAVWCDSVQRSPNSGSLWVSNNGFIRASNVNIGKFEREGIDLNVGYTFSVGDLGDVDLALFGTSLMTVDTQPTPLSDVVECKGKWENGQCVGAFPEWSHSFRATWDTPWDADISMMHWVAISSQAYRWSCKGLQSEVG